MKKFYFALAFSFMGLFVFGQTASTEVGITEGELSVSLSGAANYTIPIVVPPGINGVVPQISLNYNSQRGLSGNAARGWDIMGTSRITRIPSTKFHDGVIDPVDFDALDRFALDGQRLIVKNGSNLGYGANGTVYETEYFSNLKITSYGVHPGGANYGPAYFLIEYPDGSKAYYGNSTDSRSIMEWSILYFENVQGVRINYSYILLNDTLYVDTIKYGGIVNGNQPNEVKFVYADRDVPDNFYVGGMNVIRSKRLKEIKVSSNGLGFRNYGFSYLNVDLINKIIETSGDGTKSYNPTVFDYNMASEQIKYLNIPTLLDIGNVKSLNAGAVSGDFDADGKMDCLVYPTLGDEAKTKYWLYAGIESGINLGLEHKVGVFEDIVPATFLSAENKVLPQGWVVAKKTDADYTFTVYGMRKILSTPTVSDQYSRVVSFPQVVVYSYCSDCREMFPKLTVFPKKIISGDFNGDGLTEILAIDTPVASVKCGPRTFAGCKSVDEEIVSKSVYFIDLTRTKTSDFLTYSGELNIALSKTSKIEVGDFNGDGKSDIYVFNNGVLTIYSVDKDKKLIVLFQSSSLDNAIVPALPILIGDYNADGKSDIMIPKAYGSSQWYKYTATGTTMIKEEKTYVPVFTQNDSNTTYNYIATDYDNDGRTDLIKTLNFVQNNTGYISILPYRNSNGDFTIDAQVVSTGPKSDIDIYALPVYLPQSINKINSVGNKANSTLEIAFFNQKSIHFFNSGTDFKKRSLITNITDGNGVQESISYTPLNTQFANTYQNTPIYKPSLDIAVYPNLDILIDPDFYIVSKLEKQSKDNYKKRLFAYYGAVSNMEGLGFIGFRSAVQTDWYNDNTTMFSNIIKNDIDLRGANIQNYFVEGFREPLITLPITQTVKNIVKGQDADYIVSGSDNLVATESITLKPKTIINAGSTFSAKINESANDSPNTPQDFIVKSILSYDSSLLPNKVFRLKNTRTKQFNTLNNINTENYIEYDDYDNVVKSTNIIKEGIATVQTTVSNVGYNSPLTVPYIIGRPENKSESVSITGSTITSEEKYVYDTRGLLKEKTTRGTSTNYITENNEYDLFGNIKKKIITATGVTPREVNYEYDPSGRLLTKFTNSDRLSTSFVYYPDGTLKSETSPFASTSYTYDSWFKRLTAKDEKLNKTISTAYTKNAEKAIITTTDASEGSVMEEVFDDLGRKVKTGVKDINGALSYVSYLYDIYDRNYKTSEPYFGAAPSQWNEVKFDVYGRETDKIMFNKRTTSKNYDGLISTFTDGQRSKAFTSSAIGTIKNVNETTGGDIKYSYFADGSLKQTSYNGVNINIEQDGWGRKTKLIDPSAGTFVYNYNDFGELTSEISQNGNVIISIKRDDYGKVIEKRIVGPETKSIANYTYDSTTQLPLTIDYVDEKEPTGINRTLTRIEYDDLFKRVTTITEEKFNVTKFTKLFTYDGLGRIDTETKTAKIGNKESKVVTKNVYKNGYLYQILDNANNKVLWQTNEVNAKGQILESVAGNGIKMTNEYNNDGYLFKIKYDKTTNPVQNILTLTTEFDKKTDNLDSRINSAFGNYTETFKYDEIDRLKKFTNRLGIEETQNYDPSGKITNNSVGVYSYDDKNKPYQNNAITLTNEAAAYYSGREGVAGTSERKLIVTYNAFKSPIQIEETGIDKISFTYNDNNQRSTMYYGSLDDKLLRPWRKHYSADGTMEIKENIVTGAIEFVTYIGGDGYTAPIVAKSNGGNGLSYLYLHRDYQGTILAITDANATVVEKRLFDAWGSIIKVQDGVGNTLSGLTALDRGYTGHEHLQSVGLINMNARLYDPMLHRFLQVDNYIQDPTSTQNYNQYGYVLNNPLLYTDPSGNVTQGPGKDCIDCGPSPTEQTFIGNAIKGLANNWDSLGIKDWFKRNINGDGISQWWKSKISLKNIFGGSKKSGPPPNMSSYVSLNNASLTGAYPGTNYSNTKYNITSDYSIYLKPVDFEKVAVKTNEVATSAWIITSGLEAAGKAAPYMSGIGRYAGNISTGAQIIDHTIKVNKNEKKGGISIGKYVYRMTGTAASWGVGTAVSSWGVGGSFAGPYGVLAGIVVGAGFQGMEYSYDVVAPQIQGSFNHFFNALNSGNFVR
ncbi:RHS repeat-associated core domain-containing protein [Flavobacterium sp. WG21]|uniref:RHS repeat-associated core domain-containing protein n=1 Tax=Flavobacterium sp. WG21 TaxID=1229487 RepID=UPI00034A7C74|nr:RHS repeat-associated core domain-containing protein [Flavobacterium sp. WG21]